MTEYVWRQLYSKHSIHLEPFPKPAWSRTYSKNTAQMLTFNREVWKIKEEKNLALRDSLEMNIPKSLRQFKSDLIKMHSLILKE
jgi:valyl-tRNA synthetase